MRVYVQDDCSSSAEVVGYDARLEALERRYVHFSTCFLAMTFIHIAG